MAKEVEAASKQQEEGINQINTAIMQLDQVVQQNAAASEEAASSAEELQSQVILTEEVVEELTELILGDKKRKSTTGKQTESKDRDDQHLITMR